MTTDAGTHTTTDEGRTRAGAQVTLRARPERRLIGPRGGSLRHVDLWARVGEVPTRPDADRPALALGLVVDRSGSMHGDKLATARRAALAVLDRLTERDSVAVVVFDHQVDVLQRAAPATAEVKAALRAALGAVESRGNTALHEGWLVGCKSIAPDRTGGLARCFLLTDGLANEGLTDPEQIARDAAGVRQNAGIGTSTFGIGPDYAEGLLGPMAVAGGGQFHHLRSLEDILRTFVGELGELLAVAAPGARLEVEAPAGVRAELISPYWSTPDPTGQARWGVSLGDLLGGEERHVVLRLGFPRQSVGQASLAVRARLVWDERDGPRATPWQVVDFPYADSAARRAEVADAKVLRVVGLQHAERAERRALELSKVGRAADARATLSEVGRRIAEYAGADAELQDALARLRTAAHDLERRVAEPALMKEAYFASQMRARGQRDLRT